MQRQILFRHVSADRLPYLPIILPFNSQRANHVFLCLLRSALLKTSNREQGIHWIFLITFAVGNAQKFYFFILILLTDIWSCLLALTQSCWTGHRVQDLCYLDASVTEKGLSKPRVLQGPSQVAWHLTLFQSGSCYTKQDPYSQWSMCYHVFPEESKFLAGRIFLNSL